MNQCDKLQNKAVGFFDGSDSRNNPVSLIARQVLQKPEEVVSDIPQLQDIFKQFYGLNYKTAASLKTGGLKFRKGV